MERNLSEHSSLRLDLLEAIEFGGENEVPDLVCSASMDERSGDVRREHGFDPSAGDARKAAGQPPPIVMDELAEPFDGKLLDPSKLVRAQRRPGTGLIHAGRGGEHQPGTRTQ